MSDLSPPRTGLSAYRQLPVLVGWRYLIATSLGRLPLTMVPLAILTLATSATGSIAVGGFAAAAAAIGEAIGAPTGGSLADRWGQRTILLTGVVLHVSFLLAFGFGAGVLPDALTVALAGLAGITLPQVGALSRARWLAIAPDDLPAAFAFEGVIDEITYIFGPAIVGIIAVSFSPHVTVVLAGALVAVFVTQFAIHPSYRKVPRRGDGQQHDDGDVQQAEDAPSRRRRLTLVSLTLVGMLSMGMFFGGSQTGLTSFAEHAGIPDAGALLYAVMAVGSAVTTIAMVAVPDSISQWTRWWLAALGLTGGAVMMLLSTSLVMVIVSAVIAGIFQGPLLLTIFSVSGSLAQRGKAGIAMTLMSSGVVVGIGVGSAVAGVLSQSFGPAGGFAVVVTASALLLAMGLIMTAISRAGNIRETNKA